MNILLTNDDGYKAKGIQALKNALVKKGHTVYLIAPASNRSAVSHHINMKDSLEVIKTDSNEWSCSGYPVDCVAVGVRSDFLPVKPDCIISGINKGANLGSDIVYSGTCAAARQGVMYEIPSVAVSLEHEKGFSASEDDYSFDNMAEFIARNLEKLVSLCDVSFPYAYVNVNGYSGNKITAVEFVEEVAQRSYRDRVELNAVKEGVFSTHFLPGGSTTLGGSKSDYAITEKHSVSVAKILAEENCIPINKNINFEF